MRIPPIEEAFYVVAKFNIPVVGDELEDADSLRYVCGCRYNYIFYICIVLNM